MCGGWVCAFVQKWQEPGARRQGCQPTGASPSCCHGSDSQEDSEREAGLQKFLRAGPRGPAEEGMVAGLAGEKTTHAALRSWELRCCQLQWVCLCV